MLLVLGTLDKNIYIVALLDSLLIGFTRLSNLLLSKFGFSSYGIVCDSMGFPCSLPFIGSHSFWDVVSQFGALCSLAA